MQVSIDTCPSFKQVVEDWVSLCILADKNLEKKAKTYTKVWAEIEKSLPIIINTTESRLGNAEPTLWYVRVLSNSVTGKCIDIRQFKKVDYANRIDYIPTDIGITLPVSDWSVILETVFKFMRKYK